MRITIVIFNFKKNDNLFLFCIENSSSKIEEIKIPANIEFAFLPLTTTCKPYDVNISATTEVGEGLPDYSTVSLIDEGKKYDSRVYKSIMFVTTMFSPKRYKINILT